MPKRRRSLVASASVRGLSSFALSALSVSALSLSALSLGGCAVSPTPLAEGEISALASASIADVARDQEPISGAIDVHQAMARALKYNLDHQVELAEYAVRERELNLAHYSLLPSIVANSGYAGRDEVNASSSENALTGAQSLATSTSQDKRLRSADAAFSWNILDFGLSYVRARQAADKALIQNELRRKISLRIIEDTRAAYWRAVSAQRLLGQLKRVEEQARSVEREAKGLASDGQTSRITAYTYQREIVEVQRTIGELARELKVAKAQLSALMNVQPGTHFTLVEGKSASRALPGAPFAELISIAVSNRPELKDVAYKSRINSHEAHAALLEMLPGLNLYAGANYDSNSFLLHNQWESWGAKASLNLIKVFSYPARRAVIEEQDELLKTRALAVTMAIMTQVYVSRVRYAHAQHEFATAKRYRDVQHNLLTQIRAEASADRVSRQTLVREELNMLVAEAKLDIAHAAVEGAFAQAEASLGLATHEPVARSASVRDVAQALRARAWNTTLTTASTR
jgi:outer membrane protein TolC